MKNHLRPSTISPALCRGPARALCALHSCVEITNASAALQSSSPATASPGAPPPRDSRLPHCRFAALSRRAADSPQGTKREPFRHPPPPPSLAPPILPPTPTPPPPPRH